MKTMLKTYARLFKIRPKVLVCDRHPDYWSTALAKSIQKSHAAAAYTDSAPLGSYGLLHGR